MANWLAGIVGGIIGGAVMIGILMALAPFRGYGQFFTPPRLAAAAVQGEMTARRGGAPVAVGTLLHLSLAAVAGLFFAAAMQVLGFLSLNVSARMGVLLGCGILYGGLLFGLTRFLLLPLFNWRMAQRIPFIDFAVAATALGVIVAWFVALMA